MACDVSPVAMFIADFMILSQGLFLLAALGRRCPGILSLWNNIGGRAWYDFDNHGGYDYDHH